MLVKAFRLFVSSTFKDFVQERELLQSKVFPALDAYCAARGYQFHAVDLRWGVNEEAQLDQRTAEICLGEVSVAKGYPPPNFLVMIGDRYGWVPLPFAIPQDEFDAVVAWLESRSEHDVVHALCYVYQLDENHVIPCGLVRAPKAPDTSAYTLRSREDEIAGLKDAETWDRLETRLCNALQHAADQLLQLGRIDAATHQKYFLSLTEQEIIRGVRGFGEGGRRNGAVSPKQSDLAGPQAIAWIRETVAHPIPRRAGLLERLGLPPRAAQAAPPAAEPRLDAIKVGLRRTLPDDCILTAGATADGEGKLDDAYLANFVSTIQRRLQATIDRHIAAVEAVEHLPDFKVQSERDEHRAFAEERRRVFIGRASNRSAIANYITSSSAHPLILHGASGSGKSALMARAVADAEASARVPVFYRFIGASAASSDERTMLISLIDDLASHGAAQKPTTWEDDANRLVGQVRDVLSAIDMPVVIFLDAIDQLRKPYRPGWLPDNLPAAVKLVVSVLDDEAFPADSDIYKSLRQRLPAGAFLEIEPLSTADGHDILVALEQAARRRLQPSQRDYIVCRLQQAGALPLYLRIAFEIARGWRSTEAAGVGGRELASDITALIGQLIDELTTVHHHERELVSRTLGYIAAAKDGLSASELTEVLSRDAGVMRAISSEQHGARTSKLPVSVWVRLHRHLAALLVEKRVDEQPLMQFFHRQLAEVAREQCYFAVKTALHGALATYFDTPVGAMAGAGAKYKKNGARYTRRSLSELPFQFFHAGERSRLDEILMAPNWMQQKLNAFGPHVLVADYDQYATSDIQSIIGRTLRLSAGICARDPRQLLPQLLGRLMACADPAAPAFFAAARRLLSPPVILTRLPSLTPPGGAETARLDGHTGRVTSLALLPDGSLASGSFDDTIRLWDPTSGAEIARLEGHADPVTALVVLPDGRLASGSWDHTIRLWDPGSVAGASPSSGAETARLEGHTDWVNALAVLPDGRLASGSNDGTIRLWDPGWASGANPSSGTATARLEGELGWVNALCALPDGRLASGASDATIRLWDTGSGAETARLEGHESTVAALVLLPDGRLASGCLFGTIRLWDTESGAETARLEHAGGVTAPAVLPDGRLASASDDRTIKLWNLGTGAETARLEGHSGEVNALCALPDGRLASASEDETIRLWVLGSGSAASTSGTGIARRADHDGPVTALAVLADGRLASGAEDATIRLWDARTGAETACFKSGSGADWVLALALLSDGRLAAGCLSSTVRLWDPDSGVEITRLKGHTNMVGALALLPDGRLASGSWDSTIRLWNPGSAAGVGPRTSTETGRLVGHIDRVRALTPLPDGRIASGSMDTTIRLWDARTGAETARLQGNSGGVNALVVLADGRLASGADDGTIRLWSLRTGAETARLEGHTDSVSALALLPDGRLASGSDDGTIRIWQLGTGQDVARLEVDAAVNCLATCRTELGPQGRTSRLVAGDQFGRLHWLEIVE